MSKTIFNSFWGSYQEAVKNCNCAKCPERKSEACFRNPLLLFSHLVVSNSLQPHGPQHTRPPCPSPSPRDCSKLSVMAPNHLVLCNPLLPLPSIFPSNRVLSNELALCIRWPKYWSFSSASVLPMNIQDWFLFGLTGLNSLQSKKLSRVFFNTTI